MRRAVDNVASMATPTIIFVPGEPPELPSPRAHHGFQQQSQQRRLPQDEQPSSILTVPVAQRAACYFASNFILVPLGQTTHGFMEYLVPLIDSEPPDSGLRSAFNACAFALLGNRAKADSVNLLELSLREHTLALKRTHTALGNPATANSDATLATVLMLCIYEVGIFAPTILWDRETNTPTRHLDHHSSQRGPHAGVAFPY